MSIAFYVHDAAGRVLRGGRCPAEFVPLQARDVSETAVIGEALPDVHYIEDGAPVAIPARPSPSHTFDYDLKQWVDPRTLADFKAEALRAGAAELARRMYLPITVGGSPFDADRVSRERITGTILRLQQGRGLPDGWLGWRDFDNAMHWSDADPEQVLASLSALSGAIEDREQALLVTAWTLKAQIEAAATVDQVQAIAWPE